MKINEDKQRYSKGIVHYIYRNTDIVEDNHSNNIVMNDGFYNKVYQFVGRKLQIVCEFKELLTVIDDKMGAEEILSLIPKNKRKLFGEFISDFLFNVFYFGTDWDEAIIINEPVEGELAKYILNGKFYECCQKHIKMDDSTMELINKDINNRVFTLISKGYL